jgi:putative DNA-invertase from lambdoid prophage Rac
MLWETMKVAIYCRVSTREQTTENQRLILTEYAGRMGYQYVIVEETESTRKSRPKKYELLQQLRRKEFDAVMVLKLDRWGRSLSELVTEIDELHSKGVNFISLRDNIDLSTSTGRLQFSIMAALAQFERDLIRERTLDGLARAKKQGKRLGRPAGSKDKEKRRKSGYWLRYAKPNKSPP